MMAEELQSPIFISEGGKRKKVDKLRVLLKQCVNQAISGKPKPFESAIRLLATLDQINQTPTKKRPKVDPYAGIDIDKLSSEELIKLQRELIANSKPLSEI